MRKVVDLELTKSLHREVWNFRQINEKNFPTPSPRVAAQFMMSEIGELFDAVIRNSGEHFVRAQDRTIHVDLELADVVMMALTVLPWELHEEFSHVHLLSVHVDTLEDVAMQAFPIIREWDVLDMMGNRSPGANRMTEPVVRAIAYLVTAADLYATANGINLRKAVKTKFVRILARRIDKAGLQPK